MKSTICLDEVLSGRVKLPKGLILDNVDGVTTVRIDESVEIGKNIQAGIDEFMYIVNGEMQGMENTPKVGDYLTHSLKTIRVSYAKLAETLKTLYKESIGGC